MRGAGVAIIGDVSGHSSVFAAQVRQLGGDPTTGVLPPETTLIHTGDLVHKGPDSAGCVELAARLMEKSPGRFFSIWGNHDLHYIPGGPSVEGRRLVTLVDATTASTLRQWWDDRVLPLAVALDTSGGPVLITHAGLTVGLWEEMGRPGHIEAARMLNASVSCRDSVGLRSGSLTTGIVDRAAGPCWAEAVDELVSPWLDFSQHHEVPFSQVHGHDALVQDWDECAWWPAVSRRVMAATTVDREHRRCVVAVGSATIASVDWIMLASPPKWHTPILCFPGAVVR